MEPKYLHDQDKWMLGEFIPNIDISFSHIFLHGYVNSLAKHAGRAYTKILCKYEGQNLWFYVGEKDTFDWGEMMVNRLVAEPGLATTVQQNVLREADQLRNFANSIPLDKLSTLSKEELWNIYNTHHTLHEENYTWFQIPNGIDMFHNNFTNRVKEYLRTKNISEDDFTPAFITLTQPTTQSVIYQEQNDLLQVAEQIARHENLVSLFQTKSPAEILSELTLSAKELVQKHWEKYHYTKFLYVAGEFTLLDYINQLHEIFKSNVHPQEVKAKQQLELQKKQQEREVLLSKLNITGVWRELLDAFGNFMVSKMYRRYAQLFVLHRLDKVLKEIAKRNFLTAAQVRCLLPREMKTLLLTGTCDSEELLVRTKFCVYYAEADFETLVTGAKAQELLAQVEEVIDHSVTELKGQIGNPGYGKGVVKIIIRAEDMVKMNQGDILVSISTDPDIVPAMKKAAAIVTEQGGVTSHATIVSRELGIPCVIGTKIATRVLKDGDMVEVDANRGVVKKL